MPPRQRASRSRQKTEQKPPLAILEVGDLRLMISPSKGTGRGEAAVARSKVTASQPKQRQAKRSRPTSRDGGSRSGSGGISKVAAQPVRSSWLRTAVVLEAPDDAKGDDASCEDDDAPVAAGAPDGADDWKNYVKETRSRMEEMAEEIIHLNAALALSDAQMMSPRGRERGRGAADGSEEDASDDLSDESEAALSDVSDDVSDGDLHRSRLDDSVAESVSEDEVDDEEEASSSPLKARDVCVRAPHVADGSAGGGSPSVPSVPSVLSDVGAIASDVQLPAHRDAIIK